MAMEDTVRALRGIQPDEVRAAVPDMPLKNEALSGVLTFCRSETWAYLSGLFPDMPDHFAGAMVQQESYLDAFCLLDLCRRLEAAEPFASAELEAYQKRTGRASVSFEEFQKEVLPLCLEQAEQSKNPARSAKDNGAITTIGKRLLIPSAFDYQRSFITSIRSKGGFFMLSEQTDEKTGRKKEVKTLALDINVPFLEGLFNAVLINYISGDKTGRTKVYFPDLAKELGLDFRREKKADGKKGESRKEARQREMQRFIMQTNQIYGTIPGKNGYVKLFNTPWFDPETECLEFESPYMMELININMAHEQQAIDSGRHVYEWKCYLMHSNAANERNKAAVEMAQRVLVGVQQRGTSRPDSRLKPYQGSRLEDKDVFTWHISCKGLIIDCPQVKDQLERQKSNSGKTMVLNRAFTAMYKILRTKSDLFDYYMDASITEIIPTYSTLNDCFIYVRHYGKNPDYKLPQIELPKKRPAPKQEEKPSKPSQECSGKGQ